MQTIRTIKQSITISLVAGYLITMLFSCNNSLDTIEKLPKPDTNAYQTGKDVEIAFSDSGKLKAVLKAPVMKRYKNPEPYMLMLTGIQVNFYDSMQKRDSYLIADYAKRFEQEKKLELKYNVEIHTKDSKSFYSDHLIWLEAQKRIYSDQYIKIITPEKIIWGDGFESDESFKNYHIIKPKGEFYLKN